MTFLIALVIAISLLGFILAAIVIGYAGLPLWATVLAIWDSRKQGRAI